MRARNAVIATMAAMSVFVLVREATKEAGAFPGDTILTDQQRQAIVGQFATAFVHDDHSGIAANTTPDVTWTIPGSSKISGLTSGRDGVIALADTLAGYEIHIVVRAITFGTDTVAVALHDTGNHNGKTLNQDVVNVLTIRDGQVASVAGHFADVSSFDAYLA